MLKLTDLDDTLNAFLDAPHWYVAFSGGLDSTVLLHLVQRWCAANSGAPALSAIHINHGLQASADDWQRHCEALCRDWNLTCISRAVVVNSRGSMEAAAREARYAAFEGELPPGAVLLMAHHLDDQVETFFLRLLRGAGVEGLAGMPRSRALGQGLLSRPLLACPRADLEGYAVHHGLAYVDDPSNQNTAMDRNFLRAEVLPLLATRWPAYRQSIARGIGLLSGAADMMEATVGVPDTIFSTMGDAGLKVSQLLDASPELAAARLRAWLYARGCQAPDSASLLEFLRQLRDAGDDANPRLDSSLYTLQRYRNGVYLYSRDVDSPPGEMQSLALADAMEVPGVGRLQARQVQAEGYWLRPDERLTLRWRVGGERCRLPGRTGSRSLKTLMQELGVPPWWRDRVPLLYLDDQLLSIGDLARCESARWRSVAEPGESLWKFTWQRPQSICSD